MDSQKRSFRILMFPWLAHGHIFPFLELSSRLLTRKNFHIYLCSTAINFSSVRQFIQSKRLDDSIELLELHLEPSPELPPHYHTTKNLPPNLNFDLIKAFQTAKPSFSDITTNLNPDLVIYDGFQPWAAEIASSQGIPAVHFVVMGTASWALCYHLHRIGCDDNFPFPALRIKGHEKQGFDDLNEFVYVNVFNRDKDTFFVNFNASSEVVLVKSSWCFEGKYVDYLSGVCNKKLLPVGPLVTDPSDNENSEILEWLSKKSNHSTVYVSFGSEHYLSKEEIGEMTKALELSGVNFIWVIRFPIGEEIINIKETLPEGFLERVEERGMVVTGWAPQVRILGHPSIGAFISHCGWSSIMESMYFGVPIIGMPMKLIMFVDANMLMNAGACVRVPRKENEWYKAEDIAEVITTVIAGKSGDELRLRAQEFSENMRMEEGQEMDVVAEQLWQLCLNNKLKQQDTKTSGISN